MQANCEGGRVVLHPQQAGQEEVQAQEGLDQGEVRTVWLEDRAGDLLHLPGDNTYPCRHTYLPDAEG